MWSRVPGLRCRGVAADTGETVVEHVGYEGFITYIGWSPDGSRLATAGLNGVLVFDTWSGVLVNTYHQSQLGQGSNWSTDGKWLLVDNNSCEQTVEIWRVWQTREEPVEYARECCIFCELTAGELVLFGLAEC